MEYLKKLESFGIQILPAEKICQALLGKEKTERACRTKEACALPVVEETEQKVCSEHESRLISADMARKFVQTGETTFRVMPGMIVTPLAKDVLREKKITLVYEA